MQIEDLKIWVDLINTQNFSKCAELNFVSQPAISQKVKLLEKRYGTPLLLRSGKRVLPTHAGKILYNESKEIIEIYKSLSAKVKSSSGVVHGTIKIATIYSIGLYELNDIIRNFLNKYPSIHADMEFSQNSRIYQDILNGRIDLGFVAYPEEHPCIKTIHFKNEKLVLVANPKNNLSKFKKIDIRKLNNCEFIGFNEGIPTGDKIVELFKTHHVKVITKMKFENIELIKRAVEINLGVSILPSITVETEIKHRLLSGIPFANNEFLRPLAIVFKKDKVLSLAEEKFIEECLSWQALYNPRHQNA